MIAAAPAVLRRVPYPYRSMLAICSDLDLTPDAAAYECTARFLNTTRDTPMGPGVGLEVGNTIYFDMPPGQFAYWSADEAGRAMVRDRIRSGHVDALHSFGDLATTRAHAARALDELARHDCRLAVWIDHAVAPTNLGADRMRGSGDVPGAAAYHADLSTAYGIDYVWRGRVTSVIGQDAPPSLGGLLSLRHPASAVTVAKELAKQRRAARGDVKYAMHGPNHLLRDVQLRSGQPVVEFLRANPHWGGVSCGDTADGLAEVLTAAMLDRLEARGAVTVLYTHLGKFTGPLPLAPATVAALRQLAARQAAGRVLVATTRRLLDHVRATATAGVAMATVDGVTWIDVTSPRAPSGRRLPVDGLTIYADDPARCRVRVDGRERTDVRANPPDDTGRASLSLPWPRLAYPVS